MTKKDSLLDQLVDAAQTAPANDAPTQTVAATKTVAKESPDVGRSSMEDLLATNDIQPPRVGDVLQGTIIDIMPTGLLLDLGPIGTGIVFGRETKSGLAGQEKFKKGVHVSATVTDAENEDGYVELSIREASYEKAWEDLERKMNEKETVTTKILNANKGGLMVELNGITGFLPVSQLSGKNYPRVEDGDKNKILEILKRFIGKDFTVRILDVDRTAEKLIVSEKAAFRDEERRAVSSLSVGDTIEGDVSGVVDFGAFVKFSPAQKPGGTEGEERLEGLVHISELAWQLIDNPRDIVKIGDKVQAKIIGIDDTKISLSMKALKVDPWTQVHEKYHIGDIVSGTVDKINHFGAFVYLDKDIHGLAHVSEFKEAHPGKKMEEMIQSGKEYRWKILSIEPKDHRMGLLLVTESTKKKTTAAKKAAA
ncbi:MAG TPA: S1 RNA-binding domain-containing protein [Patescibacteria group bacterium]|nr:S1 RNA-binding domain-containing protein [Patescibacteria group bacterium]